MACLERRVVFLVPIGARTSELLERFDTLGRKLKAGTALHSYEPGTWGPKEADAIAPPGGWHDPVVKDGARA